MLVGACFGVVTVTGAGETQKGPHPTAFRALIFTLYSFSGSVFPKTEPPVMNTEFKDDGTNAAFFVFVGSTKDPERWSYQSSLFPTITVILNIVTSGMDTGGTQDTWRLLASRIFRATPVGACDGALIVIGAVKAEQGPLPTILLAQILTRQVMPTLRPGMTTAVMDEGTGLTFWNCAGPTNDLEMLSYENTL